jgi:DNA-binding transcriptional MerR regulator
MTQSTQVTFNIGELAREYDITTRSIRFYEDQGLLSPTRQGQTRIYSQKDRVRLKLLLRGKRLGFSLAEIKNIFELYDTEATEEKQMHTMLALINEKRQQLEQQKADIIAVLEELDQLEQGCQESLRNLKQ